MLKKIKAASAEGKVRWRKHALERMMERGVSRQQVKQVLMHGDVIASYQDDRPFPSLLIHGRQGRDVLHVVVGLLMKPSPIVMS